MAFTIFFFLKKLKNVEKTYFFRAKNATVSTLRSGTDYCWIYCEVGPKRLEAFCSQFLCVELSNFDDTRIPNELVMSFQRPN